MKNFKLLLATTAILSTALATGVKATGVDAGSNLTIKPSVDIITPITVTPSQDLYFGV